ILHEHALYRLASTARRPKWQYVTRAGTTTRYFWGNTIGKGKANCDGCGSQGQQAAGTGGLIPGQCLWNLRYAPEWVEDCGNSSYRGAPSNGAAWTSGDCSRRVARGGSWYVGPQYLRSVNRGESRGRSSNQGFRVGRTLTP